MLAVASLVVVVVVLVCATAARVAAAADNTSHGDEPPNPRIELYTMGPGNDLFARFGHAALCVVSEVATEPVSVGPVGQTGRCFNFGTTDFSQPLSLAWDALRGRARFWVSVKSLERMVAGYELHDRTIYRQVLPLSRQAAKELADELEHDALPENSHYTYHHFRENCSTRVRDHIDVTSRGALRAGSDASLGMSYRELVRQGFGSSTIVLATTELLVGRYLEHRPTIWEGMFLPDVLRQQVERNLGVAPETIYRRVAAPTPGNPRSGQYAIAIVALVLVLLESLLLAVGRPLVRRVVMVCVGGMLGFAALLVDALPLVSGLSELRVNEIALVLLPTDLALLWLGSRRLLPYLFLRFGLLAVVVVLSLAGILVQPLYPAVLLVTAALLPLFVVAARRAT
ncbi:MAG: DUF4105 domain-containing protein [Pseudomonadota bacterium]